MSSTSIPAPSSASMAEKFFQGSLYFLLVMGFAALAGTGKLDSLSPALVGYALLLRGYHLLKGRQVVIPERLTSFFTIIYLAFYGFDYFMLSRGFVAATVHLVLFVMVIKIFSVHRDRDLLYLAVLSFLMVLAAAVLTVDTVFLFTFCLFMLAAMATFISMEMRRSEREAAAITVGPSRERQFHRSLSSIIVLLALFTLAGSVVIFFVIPRRSMGGYLQSLGAQSDFVTGFSDGVNLGGIGRIQQSDAPIMHVQVLRGTMPPDIKWRGTSLVNFDGRRWWNPHQDLAMIRPLQNTPLDLRNLWINKAPMYASNSHRYPDFDYRIIMEPIGSYIFFLAYAPARLNGPYPEVAISEEGTVTKAEGARMIDVYDGEAETTDPEPLVRDSNSRDYPPGMALTYLQLPAVDQRIPALAQRITANAQSNYARAKAIEAYLRSNFGYTLELPSTSPADPLANFLFERKQGHCEYFASSMTIMLRSLGIPARVVNGFRGGQFNDINHTYIIRGRDAHSWVEVYFPEHGWVAFDPTPSVPAEAGTGAWSRLEMYMDAARELWREWVINYDFSHQVRLTTQIGADANAVQGRMSFWWKHKYRALVRWVKDLAQGKNVTVKNIMALALLLAIVITLPFARRGWRIYRRIHILRHPQESPGTAASFWYTRMLKIMERRGVRKLPSQTPVEFAASIEDPQTQKEVVIFTEHYERARFADSVDDVMRLPELYEQISK